jgi:hypothetical protein
MPDDGRKLDTEIIGAAYADKVKEAFMIFAENLSAGQSAKSCAERFQRALGLVKKARDLALEAISEGQIVEAEAPIAAKSQPAAREALSAEDQAMMERVLAGTTGVAKPVRIR